ncbi:hypothetical protein [Oceanobacillus indicireducens]|uniref:YtxH domain-containing protein n=1 Tax=Oceanobacillus indicireducens TaxID=1004261 RepID=A0A918CZ76_9BACI|nr:hypothetical protein [Oceanobacillus indicireducens]GGN51810.1 hypothetical protein GCM10007971_06670 [Oceanobacillus indicireducens]
MGKLTKSLGIAGAALGVAYLSKSENREKVKKLIGLDKDSQSYVKKLGRPGAVGAADDAKMVDEGALTSVQYYNKLQEEEEEEEEEEEKSE